MRTAVIVGSIILLFLFARIGIAQEGSTISGRLGATDQEVQEGYFAIDKQNMIVVKPGSAMHNYLKGKIGQRMRITVEPDTETE